MVFVIAREFSKIANNFPCKPNVNPAAVPHLFMENILRYRDFLDYISKNRDPLFRSKFLAGNDADSECAVEDVEGKSF